MREQITAKQRQAEEQISLWQQQIESAKEQLHRWQGIADVCQELLAVDQESSGDE